VLFVFVINDHDVKMLNLSSPGFHFRSFALILRRLDVNLRFSGFLSGLFFGTKEQRRVGPGCELNRKDAGERKENAKKIDHISQSFSSNGVA
jgi:hypothetical protein